MALGLGGGGGGTVGTGYVKIKPDAAGFGDELEREVGSQASGKSGAMGQKASMAFRGAFLAGTATLGKSVFDFAGFDAGMREVFTLMPDITAPAMADMTGQVKAFAGEFGVLPDEVIPSLYNSISAGVPPGNVFEFLETAQKLAKAGATDLATSVDGLSSVVNAYGPEAISAAEASDALFTAVKLGKTTVDEMSASLFQVAPIASSFGVSFDEVSASIATLTAQGTPTAVAATQMKGAIAELGKEGTKASDAFAEITGKTFPQFTAEGGTMTEALGLMQAAAEENGSSLVDMFGSIEAGQAALGLTKDLEKTNANLLAVGDSAGATQVAFETMNEGLSATMSRLKARFSVLMIDLGESLAPTIEVVGEAVAGLLEIFMAMPAPMRTMIVVGGTLLAGLAAFAGPILKAIQLFKMLGGVMTLLAANPWMLAVLALIAVTYLIIKNWDDVKAALEAVWNWIEDAAGALADWFVGAWEAVSGAVVAAWDGMTGGIMAALDAIGGAIETAWTAITDATVTAWTAITGAVSTAWDAITGAVSTAIYTIGEVISAGFEAVSAGVSTAWSTITGIVSTAVGTVTAVVQGAWNTLVSITSTAWSGLSNTVTTKGGAVVSFVTGIPGKITAAFTGLANAISAPFVSAFNAIKNAWNRTVGGFSVSIPKVMGFGGASFKIPSMAFGGIAESPMLAMIGDAGTRNPEIVTPENLMRQVVTDALADAGGSSSGIQIVTNLNVDGMTDETKFRRMLEEASTELVRVYRREIERTQRGSGRGMVGSAA